MRNIKRKVKMIGDIAANSIAATLGDGSSLTLSAGVGLIQGLKYNGSLKRGVKAGVATMCVVASIDVVKNVARNWHIIQAIDDVYED